MMDAAVPDVDRLCVRGFSNEDSDDSEDGEWLTSVAGNASAPPYSPLMVYTFGGTAVSGGGGRTAGLPLSSPPPPSLLTMLDVVVMTESGRCSGPCSDRRTVSCSYVGRSRSEAKQWVRVVPAAAGGRGGKNPSSGRTGEGRSVEAGS